MTRLHSPIRRPVLALAGWCAAVALLGIAGALTGGRLVPTTLLVPGSESDRAAALSEAAFGRPETDQVVMLGGPARRIEREGPRLVRRLRSLKSVAVTSPWQKAEAAHLLRPAPGRALLALSYPAPSGQARELMQERIARTLDASLSRVVQARVTGPGVIGRALERHALESVGRAELIALPVLVVVLMLVFRSPIAAAIPLVFGAGTVVAARGAIGLLSSVVEVDVFAVTLASMMGLALGVDYSLLLVSRFREELRGGRSVVEASSAARSRAGHTVLLAGGALSGALLAALAVAPGGILFSTVAGALIAALLASAGTVLALPPLLRVLGPRVGLGRPTGADSGPSRWLGGLVKKPLVPALLVTGLLLLMAAPALGLRTGPPDVAQLPPGAVEREDFELISRAAGAGWTSPFVVVVRSDRRRINTRAAKLTLELWRARLADLRPRAVQIRSAPGGRAARIVIAPAGGPNEPSTLRFHRRLRERAADLGRRLRAEVAVGGQPAEFAEFRQTLAARAPLIVLAIALSSALVLLVVFRSLAVPLIAVVLNLLAVAAAFGVLALLFQGAAPLGGPGFIDALSLVAAYAVVFGLSIDYQVFLIARMREEFGRTRDTRAAIATSLRRTAAVVSGAAAIMVGVFSAFALADMAAIRQLGTALALAIALDATLVRLVLLPSASSLLGERLWWLPDWLVYFPRAGAGRGQVSRPRP